jgi:hypothetical protein
MPAVDRFWRRVQKTATCWIWTGGTNKGYGKTHGRYAHRRAYELLVGPIPPGLELDHLCAVPLCVNPDHLEPVTRTENIDRRTARLGGSPTSCSRGHEYTPENTYVYMRPGRNVPSRVCRACNRIAVLKYAAKRSSEGIS